MRLVSNGSAMLKIFYNHLVVIPMDGSTYFFIFALRAYSKSDLGRWQ